MYCRNCAQELDETDSVCPKCGVPIGRGKSYCPACGKETEAGAMCCGHCDEVLIAPEDVRSTKSKLVAGLLGIFFGSFGVHNFYLGYTKRAILQIVVTLCTCCTGSLWGIIEGFVILFGHGAKDPYGLPLK